MAGGRRIAANLNLGAEQAEADPLLAAAFYESGIYAAIADRSDPHCFLIGRTGSGKSAIVRRLEDEQSDHVIRLDPENLSLGYIIDLGVIRTLSALDVHLDPLFIALWKHVFLVEILRHRYKVDTPDTKRNILGALRDKVKRDPSKLAALEYLEQFGESFWCETDVRVREITSNFEKQIGLTTEGQVTLPGLGGVKGGASAGLTRQSASRIEETERYQRIVNETQLPRLNKMISVLDDDVLESPHNFTYIVIDDLDRDWVDERLQNDLIRCLFRAALDLVKISNLKIVVALRTNIFAHLNFGARTGGQEEKFRALAVHVRWTRSDLRAFADERAKVAAHNVGLSNVRGIHDLLPPRSKKRGDPFDYLLDRTLMRPRDVIAFTNECFANGSGRTRLAWEDLFEAELRYSRNRLLALRDEWKPTFAGIDQVFDLFHAAPVRIDREVLTKLLDNVALLVTRENFTGVVWLTDLSEPLWSNGSGSDWAELYQPLITLLYDIGFLMIRSPDRKMRVAHESQDHAESRRNLNEAVDFSVHPAFRLALDIR